MWDLRGVVYGNSFERKADSAGLFLALDAVVPCSSLTQNSIHSSKNQGNWRCPTSENVSYVFFQHLFRFKIEASFNVCNFPCSKISRLTTSMTFRFCPCIKATQPNTRNPKGNFLRKATNVVSHDTWFAHRHHRLWQIRHEGWQWKAG